MLQRVHHAISGMQLWAPRLVLALADVVSDRHSACDVDIPIHGRGEEVRAGMGLVLVVGVAEHDPRRASGRQSVVAWSAAPT